MPNEPNSPSPPMNTLVSVRHVSMPSPAHQILNLVGLKPFQSCLPRLSPHMPALSPIPGVAARPHLCHEDLSERLEVLAQLLLCGLPGQAEHDQVGALLLQLEPLRLGQARLQQLIVLALVFCQRVVRRGKGFLSEGGERREGFSVRGW